MHHRYHPVHLFPVLVLLFSSLWFGLAPFFKNSHPCFPFFLSSLTQLPNVSFVIINSRKSAIIIYYRTIYTCSFVRTLICCRLSPLSLAQVSFRLAQT